MHRVLGVILLMLAGNALAQTACRMPNGTIITMRLSGCPQGGVPIDANGRAIGPPTAATTPPDEMRPAARAVKAAPSTAAPPVPTAHASPPGNEDVSFALTMLPIAAVMAWWLYSRQRRRRRLRPAARHTRDRTRYDMTYIDSDGRVTSRTISDVRASANQAMFDAYCHSRREDRTFRFDRIIRLAPTKGAGPRSGAALFAQLHPGRRVPIALEERQAWVLVSTLRTVIAAARGRVDRTDRQYIQRALSELVGARGAVSLITPLMRERVSDINPYWLAHLLDDEAREIAQRTARAALAPRGAKDTTADVVAELDAIFNAPEIAS